MFQEVIFVEAWYHAKSNPTCSIAFATPSAQFAPSLRPLCSGCCWNDAQHSYYSFLNVEIHIVLPEKLKY